MKHCRKKGNRWYFRLNWTDENGKRCQREQFGGYSESDCKKAWRAAMRELDATGTYKVPEAKHLDECLREWLEFEVKVNCKQNTYDSYETVVRAHIVPKFGSRPIRKITTAVLQDWLNSQRKTYSRSTLKTFLAVLKNAFKWFTINRNYIQSNPAEHLSAPRYNELPKAVYVFTAADVGRIFARFTPEHRFYMPLILSYYTGMRLGECLALTWDSVDMKRRLISVTTTLYDKKGLATRGPTPKSKHSVRCITFGQKLYDALKRQEWQQRAAKFKAGTFYTSSNFVCTDDSGAPLTSNAMRYFGQWCKKEFGAGSFHSIRHTHATTLYENGADLDYVSHRLGHASVYTTANIYTSVTDTREKKMVELIDKIL